MVFRDINKTASEQNDNKIILEFTGERLVPGKANLELELEHMNRYRFSCQFSEGKRVLDAACGTGYGTAMLADKAKSAIGIDIAQEAIDYANSNYKRDNLSFVNASVSRLPFPDKSFDLVVSYETIEHIDQITQLDFLHEVMRVLDPNGILVISTPNKEIYKQRGDNHFHIHELELDEFKALTSLCFKNTYYFSQKSEICNIIISENEFSADVNMGLPLDTSEYILAVCSNQEVVQINTRICIRDDDNLSQLMNWAIFTHQLNEQNNRDINKLLENEVKLIEENKEYQSKLNAKAEELAALYTNFDKQVIAMQMSHQNELSVIQKTHEREFADFVLRHKEEFIKYKIDQNCIVEELEEQIANQADHIDLLLESDRALERIRSQFASSKRQLEETSMELSRIRSSKSWKIMSAMWMLSSILIPVGTKRRMFGKLVYNMFRHPIASIKLLTPHNISVLFRRVKNGDIAHVENRVESLLGDPAPIFTPILIADSGTSETYASFALPHFERPRVSIIVPTYNQFHYTYQCLKSINSNIGETSFEVILADDVSNDETIDIAYIISNLRIVRQKENLRFLRNCNAAAKEARGEFIFFLNNDTQVQDNWLDSLIDLMDRDNSIGICGSKLIYPDGRLQEAGGIVWEDASAWNYGRLDNPDKPEYNYVRDVDYISGAALMIRKSLWDQIGGFDERFAPAYYEDTDLCFEARAHGTRVVYQPLSVIVHYEGISNGTDISLGQKKYQEDNAKSFYKKWSAILKSEHFLNGNQVFYARDRSQNKKTIMFIDHYVPMFDKDAGSRNTFLYVNLYIENGYHVLFLGDNFYPHQPYTQILEQMGVEVLHGPWYRDNWKLWLKDNGKNIDFIWLNRPHISEKYIGYIRKITNATIIYHGHDLHFARLAAQYEVEKNIKLLEESAEWEKRERKLFSQADIILTVSEKEKIAIEKMVIQKPVFVLPIFYFDSFPSIFSFSQREGLLFVGGFAHPPNVDAVLWFANEIIPLLPLGTKLIVAGSNPSQQILNLKSENIDIRGFVSDEELVKLYNSCRVAVIPLRFGAGVKGKTIEAMHNLIPIVSTSFGIEGLQEIDAVVSPKDNARDFAEEILKFLYSDNECYEAARKYKVWINKWFSRKRAVAVIDSIQNNIKTDLIL